MTPRWNGEATKRYVGADERVLFAIDKPYPTRVPCLGRHQENRAGGPHVQQNRAIPVPLEVNRPVTSVILIGPGNRILDNRRSARIERIAL